MSDTQNSFTKKDREFLKRHGVGVSEARRQWGLLTKEARPVVLVRPCTVGDGIRQLATSEHAALREAHREAAAQGRWLKFVPASGAASRMFAFDSDDEKRRFCDLLERLALAEELRKGLAQRGVDLSDLLRAGRHDELIDTIVSPAGLAFGQLPKGLVEFHAYPNLCRTPFEEHLLEAMACLGNADGTTRCHFTVAAEHRDQFADHLRQFELRWGDVSCEVSFSIQQPSTDTIAMTGGGKLLRNENGDPVLRPGGHGALLENLNAVQGDLIFVKNIDNVGHEHQRDASVAWTQILGGYLVGLQQAVHRQLRGLCDGDDSSVAAARDFMQRTFPAAPLPETDDPRALRSALTSCLRRPLRVCGMVRNAGEPGGGPFWVEEAGGNVVPQIVEAAEVAPKDAKQETIFQQATHFNPVFMALSVRDEFDKNFVLRRFVDEHRPIITQKNLDGKMATVLERPGLWNGAMAGWNSVFVEVPMDVFSPVKTVLDLLRPEHQPRGQAPPPVVAAGGPVGP